MSTMNRNDAIREDNAALDELARISEELETINLLIVHFRQRPRVIRKLAMIRAREQRLMVAIYGDMVDRKLKTHQIAAQRGLSVADVKRHYNEACRILQRAKERNQ